MSIFTSILKNNSTRTFNLLSKDNQESIKDAIKKIENLVPGYDYRIDKLNDLANLGIEKKEARNLCRSLKHSFKSQINDLDRKYSGFKSYSNISGKIENAQYAYETMKEAQYSIK